MSIYITRALGVGSTLGILLMVYMGKGITKNRLLIGFMIDEINSMG